MEVDENNYEKIERKEGKDGVLCNDYVLGKCEHSQACRRLHPANLNPQQMRLVDYDVSNVPGVSCFRCLQRALPCDKKPGTDEYEPCSECRWFGGEKNKCIVKPTSLNDVLWKAMLNRAKQGYTLPDYKPRDFVKENIEGPKKPTKTNLPVPMRDDHVADSWTGESKEHLLALGDMLPADVRLHPRAYLVPPRDFEPSEKAQGKKRKHTDGPATQTQSPSLAAPVAHSQYTWQAPDLDPPEHPVHGEVKSIHYAFSKKGRTSTTTYANGATNVLTAPPRATFNAPVASRPPPSYKAPAAAIATAQTAKHVSAMAGVQPHNPSQPAATPSAATASNDEPPAKKKSKLTPAPAKVEDSNMESDDEPPVKLNVGELRPPQAKRAVESDSDSDSDADAAADSAPEQN